MKQKEKSAKVIAYLLSLLVLLVFTHSGKAGDLEPGGPPTTGTMKTLDEVEPRILIPGSQTPASTFVISEPGSYYLTGDRHASTNAILVEVNDVTIDLMGYSLIGLSGCGWGRGIDIIEHNNVEVRNGTVRNFGSDGIREIGKALRVINVRALSNGDRGIAVGGTGAGVRGHLIKDCTAAENGNTGVSTGAGCTVMGNTAHDNGGPGIVVGAGSTMTGNTASNNNASGILLAGIGCTVAGNTAYGNQQYGIDAYSNSNGCVITGNTVYENGVTGIYANSGCAVIGNTAYGNQRYGIRLGSECLVDQNTAYFNNRSGGGYANISACATCTFGLNHAPAP